MVEYYPQWLAGQDITADQLNLMLPLVARKTSDTSKTSTTTPTADPELQFTLAANAVYVMDGWIKYSGPGDLLIDWQGPSGVLGEWVGFGNGTTVYSGSGASSTATDVSSSSGYMVRTETNDVEQSRTFGGISTNTYAVIMKGTVRTSSGGSYQFLWSQGTSNATATTVYSDSSIILRRIA